jgi:hypothetical protein
MNPEIFYLIGALRDGCLTTGFTVKYAQRYREWLSNVILPLINKNFNLNLTEKCIYYQSKKWPFWYIAVSNKKLWHSLNKIKVLIPRTKKEQKFYIKGFWDADGGCPRNPVINKKNYIKFTQKDKKSLEELKNMLEKNFKIRCGNVIKSEENKNGFIWRFSITNKNGIVNFCKNVGSLHPVKRIRLEKMKSILLIR